jgi:hypothetical protein
MYTNFGVFGLDSYFELGMIGDILRTGHWELRSTVRSTVLPYPLLHIAAASLQLVTGISASAFALGVGVLSYVIPVSMFGCAAKRFFNDWRLVLSTTTAVALTGVYIRSIGHFSRFWYSIIIFSMAFWCVIKIIDRSILWRDTTVLLILLFGAIFTHPLTRVILITLFLAYASVASGQRIDQRVRDRLGIAGRTLSILRLFPTNIQPQLPSASIFRYLIVLGAVLISIHSVFLIWTPSSSIYTTIGIVTSIFTPASSSLPAFGSGGGESPGLGLTVPLRRKFYNYGMLFLVLVFLTAATWARNRIERLDLHVLTVFSGFVLFGNVFIYYFDIVGIFRVFVFVWPALLFAGFKSIDRMGGTRIVSIFLVVFVIINLAGVSPFLYDRAVEPDNRQFERKLTEQQVAAVQHTEYEGRVLGNHYILSAFRGESRDITSQSEPYRDPDKLQQFDWIFLTESDKTHLLIRGEQPGGVNVDMINSDPKLQRVYDNGGVFIFRSN